MDLDNLIKKLNVAVRAVCDSGLRSLPVKLSRWKSDPDCGWAIAWQSQILGPPQYPVDAISESEETELRELLSQLPAFSDGVYVAGSGGPITVEATLYFLFKKSIVPSGAGFTFSQEALSNALDKFRTSISATSAELKFVVSLERFSFEIDRMALPDGLTLRRLSEEEVNKLYPIPEDLAQPFDVPHGRDFALEGALTFNVSDKPEGGELLEERLRQAIAPVLLALNVLGDGGCRPGGSLVSLDLGFPAPWPEVWVRQNGLVLGPSYKLLASDVEGVSTILRSLADHKRELADPKGRLKRRSRAALLAAERLAEARTRDSARDRLLDAVFALEIILCAASKTEISYRFRLHLASLFETSTERMEMLERAKKLYTARSGIVHGEEKVIRIGDRELSTEEMATMACSMAQKVVLLGLLDESFQFTDDNFWERKLLGASG